MPTTEDNRLIRSIEARGARGGLYICEGSENLLKDSIEDVVRNGVEEINQFSDVLKIREMASALIDLRRNFTPDSLMTRLGIFEQMDERVVHIIGYAEWAKKPISTPQGTSSFGAVLDAMNPPQQKGMHLLLWMRSDEISEFLQSDTINDPRLMVRNRQGIYPLASIAGHDVMRDGLTHAIPALPKLKIVKPK